MIQPCMGIERHRGKAHQRVLHEDEEERSDKEAALVHRQGKGIADESTERLDLLCHHGNQFAGTHTTEMRRRKTKDAAVELVAQPAKHALAKEALVDIDGVLEAAVGQHECQEEGAVKGEQAQTLHFAEMHAEDDEFAKVPGVRCQRFRICQNVVDDQLGYVEGHVIEGQGENREDQDEDLFLLRVPEDEPVDGGIHEACRRSLGSPGILGPFGPRGKHCGQILAGLLAKGSLWHY